MRSNDLKATSKTVILAVTIFLLAAGVCAAQQQVNLAAGPTSVTLPDGSLVQMWGYSCGALVDGSTATCAALNPAATGWSPVVITVPTGQDLQINLTNNLTFSGTGVPTSLVIVGQLGGGLGTSATYTPSPTHNAQELTWPVQGDSSNGDPTNSPPPQGLRVQSFATEVAAGSTTSLTWTAPRPGTYLLESGTHPSIQGPMGLYGIVVVTAAPTTTGTPAPGTAYPAAGSRPAITYDADVALLFSEIDPVQNNAVSTAVNTAGFSETMVWSGQPGGCGNPASPTYNQCYPPAVNYTPLYYLINGVAFDKTNAAVSLFPALPAGATGSMLVRLVNAGLRMHVPSIVGSLTGSAPVQGFSIMAEDGNPLPGLPRIQSEVFMAAGKTYDVMVNMPAPGATALPVFDRQLSLSGNATARDAGMLAYIGVPSIDGNGGVVDPPLPTSPAFAAAVANPDTYNAVINGQTLTVSDPAKGVIANDVNVYGVQISGTAPAGLDLHTDGTFTYSGGVPTQFTYCANGTSTVCAPVTLGAAQTESDTGITVNNDTYPNTANPSNLATRMTIKPPGVLANDKDAVGYPLTAEIVGMSGVTVTLDPDGGFIATVAPHTGTVTPSFTYRARNSQGTLSAGTATVNLTFPAPSNIQVTLVDGLTKAPTPGQDYRWIIEEDRTFYVDPNCQTNPLAPGCPTATPSGTPSIFGTNFHASYMPIVAQGCTGDLSCESGQTVLNPATGNHDDAVCDVGNGACRPGTSQTPVLPSEVQLDPTKHYYISVLPGNAADPGHAMGGAQLVYQNGSWQNPSPPQTSVAIQGIPIVVEPQLQNAAKVSVFVFEDDHPLNGEHDAGGGVDVISPNEAGLGQFDITILDLVGGSGDAAGQMMYDEFGNPLANSLAGTIDPVTGKDACPISKNSRTGTDGGTSYNVSSNTGITGTIPVCPKYESDGTTLSPLAGQAIIVNVPPGRYGIVATPGADRIARGEEWLQTNTLDGGKDHEAFIRINEPQYFQEFGPGSFHVSIGFANPKWINDQGTVLCSGPGAPPCTQTVKGKVTGARMSRTPDERLYESGSRDEFSYTQCYASLGTPDGADFAFAKCDDQGNFTLPLIPAGDWRVTIFDQWNDQIVDGITTPVRVGNTTNQSLCHGTGSNSSTCDMGDIGVHGWKNNLYTRSFIDQNGDGISQDNEPGLALVSTNIRYRDGSFSNFNSTDLQGFAGFNEVFPIFNWYVVESDTTRYKNTGTHVINDAGGPADFSPDCGTTTNGFPLCGNSTALRNLARTKEDFSLPTELRVPGAVYCDNADCNGFSIANGPGSSASSDLSTGRIDPPWVTSYGWQSFMGQNQLLEFGKKPYAAGENGGIRGHVVYASTRPFDDPALELQLSWEPLVPHVTINLYKEGFAADGVTPTLTLVDTTQTSSWDDWAQGFRSDGEPNMNCPGQSTTDPFYNVTLLDQPNLLNPGTPLPNHSQYKCYDGMHNWNQLEPAPYDGMYQFPSVTSRDPQTGKPTATNCTICTGNTAVAPTDWDYNLPMLPAGKYVVEMIVPPGYELVKEEDKNILLGDAYEAPVVTEFIGFGNIFIMPDQASVAATYNPNNPLNPTTDLGSTPRHEGDTGSVETFWPCVGAERIVPDYVSLFPQSGQVSPFAGATRPLCDRKEVTLADQMSVLAKFYVFTSTHIASHFTGIISDDFTSEFDPFAPAFGEKFSPPNLPVSVKDWAGNEISRMLSDEFGLYNGLTYSTWSVNPPDPSGYIPQMMIMCMNDRGSGASPDPFYQPEYSQFCYEWSFMPGQTGYLDTPVIPTGAFAPNYNHPDCNYPDSTPAISEVDGDGIGPWIAAGGSNHPITIHALLDQDVDSYAYSGPGASAAPYNQKKITRHYGFGATQGSGSVTIGGITATVSSWTDSQIVVTVPGSGNNQVPACTIQQQQQFGAPTGNGNAARCGELVVTAGNGKKSVDTVTVTVGGKQPVVVTPDSVTFSGTGALAAASQACVSSDVALAGAVTKENAIQTAIDCADPGDLIIVAPGIYHELLQMWKPVRLQGVGAASTIIDANAHPAGILDPWRLRTVCLFGLAPNGVPAGYDPNCGKSLGWTHFIPTTSNPQVDRLPLEAAVGWDATLNGNLAEQLQEPSLLGAYEGAGITVLSKGVRVPSGLNPWTDGAEAGGFPTGTTLLSTSNRDCGSGDGTTNPNLFPSSFQCNPSRIDGLSVTNSSQGGGGVFVHGWAHNLEISNNRVYNNQGTLAGGISVGQGEHPGAYLGGAGATNAAPGSCLSSNTTNLQLPYCFNWMVNVHNNAVNLNASEGDELFSATPSGSGGVAISSGADFYRFNDNWVCGNLSTGDGAGISQLGFVYGGDIEHNVIVFNQATNPTTPSNGGGLLIMSAPDTDPTCPGEPDADCSHAYGTVGDGVGPGLVVNANLITGNAAEAGAGGGIRFQGVNGVEVSNFPNGNGSVTFPGGIGSMSPWYSVSVTNNIITNNVAGWDAGGVSLQDSIGVNLINNTIASNDSTASSGSLFGAFFASQASAPTPCPRDSVGGNIPCVPLSDPQPAGLSSAGHSEEFLASLPASITCPTGHGSGGTGTGGLTNGACRAVSFPILYNDVLWQNRAFNIVVANPTAGSGEQQATVTLVPQLAQTNTGDCITPPSPLTYWDIGLRGDHGPTDHSSGYTFTPQASFLTSTTGYVGGGTGFQVNSASNPSLVKQYCNGSKVPPEAGAGAWYTVPPGTNEQNVPIPVFSQTAGATVDEGNNWINISWGPLSLISPASETNPSTEALLGNYALAASSPAINYITSGNSGTTYAAAPNTDFFGNGRKGNLGSDTGVDAGAVELVGAQATAALSVSPGSLSFGNVAVNTTSAAQNLTLSNTGGAQATGINLNLSSNPNAQYTRVTTPPFPGGAPNCGATLAAGSSCTIKVAFAPTASGDAPGTAAIAASVTVTNSPVTLSGTGVAAGPIANVTGGPLAFGNVATGATSSTQNLTLHNTGTATLTSIAVAVTSPFARVTTGAFPTGAGNCGGTLAAGANCTIKVAFSPTTAGAAAGTVTINASVTVTGSPVALTGIGVAPSAGLDPAMWTTMAVRGCSGGGLCPTQVFQLTNTGIVNLTGITRGTLGGANASEFTIVRSLSTCGPANGAGGQQPQGITTLAPGASCQVTVSFTPLTNQTTGTKTATVSVTDSAGTQTSSLTGNAQ